MTDHHHRECRKRWVLPFAGEMGPNDCPTCRALRLKAERPDHAFADEPVELLELMYAPKMATPRPAAESEYEDFRDKPAHEAIEEMLERALDKERRRQETRRTADDLPDALRYTLFGLGPSPSGFARGASPIDALRRRHDARLKLARHTVESVEDMEWHLKAAWRAGYDWVDVLLPDSDPASGMTDAYVVRTAHDGDEPAYLADPDLHVQRFCVGELEPGDIPTLHDKTNTGGDEDAPEDRGAEKLEFLTEDDFAGKPDSFPRRFAGSVSWSGDEDGRPGAPPEPEGLGPCVGCGRPVTHDEVAARVDFRFNCHGGWMDDTRRADGLYHHRCLREVLFRDRPSPAERALRDILERVHEALEEGGDDG